MDRAERIVEYAGEEYDRYGQYAIRHAVGTNKSVIERSNKVALDSPLSFGKILCEEPYKRVAEIYLFNMSFDHMVNTVTNVYGEKFPKEEAGFFMDGTVEEVLKRIYPPYYNWLNHPMGMDQHKDGEYSDRLPVSEELSGAFSGSREERMKAFSRYVSGQEVEEIRARK